MERADDAQMGAELVRRSLDYLEQDLPRYMRHTDRYWIDVCYLAVGQPDKALLAIEERLNDRHYDGWWWLRKLPVYEPLWGDPSFEAAMRKVEDEMAIQRTRLAPGETAANF